jgi:hypothetical protein
MKWYVLVLGLYAVACFSVRADPSLQIPVTPFSNMEQGYQATNPGFRIILKTQGGVFITGAPLTMDAVITGTTDDASEGTPYGKLILNVRLPPVSPALAMLMDGNYEGSLSICMASDPTSALEDTVCKNLTSAIRDAGRPFQWIDKSVGFSVQAGNATITRFDGDTGEGGTTEQIALSTFHPAFGFAAPGKAFKDYQSPLVLDLSAKGKLELTNVWNDRTPIYFDLAGTGKKVRTGWTAADEGFLFVDDGSGCVHDGTQLIGEYTETTGGKKRFENGFIALEKLFDPNHSGRVVVAQHPALKVWRNRAMDGVCKLSEVFPAGQFIKEIDLNYQKVTSVKLTADNEIRVTGSYVAPDQTRHLVADVWFKQRRNPKAYLAKR